MCVVLEYPGPQKSVDEQTEEKLSLRCSKNVMKGDELESCLLTQPLSGQESVFWVDAPIYPGFLEGLSPSSALPAGGNHSQ